jgi:ketosteroid isomerase-like protein
LEDAAAIRNLKARYAALCDAQYDADGIAMLFTEDALWESPDLGRFEGREAISTA